MADSLRRCVPAQVRGTAVRPGEGSRAGRAEPDGVAHQRERGVAGGAAGAGDACSSSVVEKGSVDFDVGRCSAPFAGANRSRFEGLGFAPAKGVEHLSTWTSTDPFSIT